MTSGFGASAGQAPDRLQKRFMTLLWMNRAANSSLPAGPTHRRRPRAGTFRIYCPSSPFLCLAASCLATFLGFISRWNPAADHAPWAGFLVHNDRTYANLTQLFAELGMPRVASDRSFAVSYRKSG
jgi:hypothetical protein